MDCNLTKNIPEYFSGRSVFITGATGFMGKVLMEKLLRSCPDVGNVYILVRNKKNKNAGERIKEITETQLFDRLKFEQPHALEKLKPISGDILERGMGILEEDKAMLVENVSIVYHTAASVRFDDPLKHAILVNTRSTRDVVRLASEMKNLSVLVYVSTAYSNCDRHEIDEQLYPAHADWRKLIEIGESTDESMLNLFSEMVIKELPNTYIFTKSLAEHVIHDLCGDKIPAVICRPSIVAPTIEEPVVGWIDNFNGPAGLSAAIGKGVLRTIYGRADTISDYIPVDVAIKGMLIATWLKGQTQNNEEKRKISIYNNTGCYKISLGNYISTGVELTHQFPLNNVLWYPWAFVSRRCYYYSILFLHVLPALALDSVLRVLRKKPRLLKLIRRIYSANLMLGNFMSNDWIFLNDNYLALDKKLLPEDAEDFHMSVMGDYKEYFRTSIEGGREYLLKEDLNKTDQAKKKLRIMYLLHIFFIGALYLTFVLVLSHELKNVV